MGDGHLNCHVLSEFGVFYAERPTCMRHYLTLLDIANAGMGRREAHRDQVFIEEIRRT